MQFDGLIKYEVDCFVQAKPASVPVPFQTRKSFKWYEYEQEWFWKAHRHPPEVRTLTLVPGIPLAYILANAKCFVCKYIFSRDHFKKKAGHLSLVLQAVKVIVRYSCQSISSEGKIFYLSSFVTLLLYSSLTSLAHVLVLLLARSFSFAQEARQQLLPSVTGTIFQLIEFLFSPISIPPMPQIK